MKKLVPLVMLLIGTGAGVGAGLYLRPAEVAEAPIQEKADTDATEKKTASESSGDIPIAGKEYVKLSNQFVVPIVKKDRISSMIVMTLSVETSEGRGQDVYDVEPKIRDAFLEVLFDHATIGGFDGAFLDNDNLNVVRGELKKAALKNFGPDLISDVLIFEIARQDY